MNIDSLIDLRQLCRANGHYDIADKIRCLLDERCVFVFDDKDGQVVYHFNIRSGMTREKVIHQIQKDIRAEKRFDAWLYSIKNSNVQKTI